MSMKKHKNTRGILGTAALLTALAAAACAPVHSTEPTKVSESKPSVSYKYTNDSELIRANRRAAVECGQYKLVPETASIVTNQDGQKVVTFDCVATPTQAAATPAGNPNLTYTYRTDQQLIQASREAEVYCRSKNMRQGSANTVVNADGSKTVTFECEP